MRHDRCVRSLCRTVLLLYRRAPVPCRCVPLLAAAAFALSGCSIVGYTLGTMADRRNGVEIEEPVCAEGAVREGERVRVERRGQRPIDGNVVALDCVVESVLVLLEPAGAEWYPGGKRRTFAVPLAEVERIERPAQNARYAGLIVGGILDAVAVGLLIHIHRHGGITFE